MREYRKYLIAVCLVMLVGYVSAQTNGNQEIRIFYGDVYPSAFSGFAGNIFPNAMLDEASNIHKKNSYAGIFGLGYRYGTGRFRLGGDLALTVKTTDWTLTNESSPAVRDKEYWAVIMPTGEWIYFKKGSFELYSSVGLGAMLAFDHMEELNTEGIGDNKNQSALRFAYQVDPVAARIQGKKFGYFIEGGVGYKGFVSAGVDYRF